MNVMRNDINWQHPRCLVYTHKYSIQQGLLCLRYNVKGGICSTVSKYYGIRQSDAIRLKLTASTSNTMQAVFLYYWKAPWHDKR